MDTYHTSVLLQQTIHAFNIKKGDAFIDATLGGGGHTTEILKLGGRVLGIDVDQEAIEYCKEVLPLKGKNIKIGENLLLAKGNFKDIDVIAEKEGFAKVKGILFDLGVSSHQFDEANRGFSFQKEGMLDMRMDQDLQVKALDLINALTKGELHELFVRFGEERFAKTIATAISSARRIKPITGTTELADIIKRAVRVKAGDIHPATRVFQALRIAVNDELTNITEALPKALGLLVENGRIVVISFHSLEDRIVKRQFLAWEEKGLGRIVTKKPIVATEEEIEKNKRSRSAKLRIFEKLHER